MTEKWNAEKFFFCFLFLFSLQMTPIDGINQ